MNRDKRQNRSKRFNQGITLTEVLFTTLILSVVIVGSIGLFAKCRIFTDEIKVHTIVNNALNEQMEEIRGYPYSTITTLSAAFDPTVYNASNESTWSGTGALALEDPFTDDNIRKVTLTVNWTSPQGRALSKSMVAYFTNTGINKQ